MTTDNLTLDNFAKETGFRFRVSKNQAARIALTSLSDDVRGSLINMAVNEAVNVLENSKNTNGKPFNWVKTAIDLAAKWNEDSLDLTRSGAFQEFLADGGLTRLQNRNPEIPDSVYLDDTLTLANFTDKVEAAIGMKRRFRVSRNQNTRLKAGELTREQALAEVVASKQVANGNNNPNTDPASTTEVLEGIETTGS